MVDTMKELGKESNLTKSINQNLALRNVVMARASDHRAIE